MTFGELVQGNAEAIIKRWLDDALATYADDAAKAFGRRKDRFDNPVGHSLRQGTREIFNAILEGMDEKTIQTHLFEIIRIRAVQQFSPSQSLTFIFSLKKVLRDVVGAPLESPELARQLADFDGSVDRVGLMAFDTYVQCREQYHNLRVNELKRQIPWAVSRMNQKAGEPDETPVELTCEPPES